MMSLPIYEHDLPRSVQRVLREARSKLAPEAIILYGSRARGTASPTSDFDFALVGISASAPWADFSNYVQEEAPCLFGLDLVRYEETSDNLKRSIDGEGRLVIKQSED